MDPTNIYIYGDGGVSDDVRLKFPITNIKPDDELNLVISAGVVSEGMKLKVDPNGVYVFSRPVTNLELAVNKLKSDHGDAVKIIADLDDSFWDIPKHHVAYEFLGQGSQNLRSMERIFKLVDKIVVSTEPLKKKILERCGRDDIVVIPNVCNVSNPYTAFKRPSEYVRFGFSGTITHREDFKLIKSALVRFINDHSNAQVVIGADAMVYRTLDGIAEKQKLFIPAYPYSLYPLHLSYFDVMLIPLIKDNFNDAKSDIKLLDAVSNQKPFIASDVTPYHPYNEGDPSTWAGIIAGNNPDDWYSAMAYMMSWQNRFAFVSAGEVIKKEKSVAMSSALWKKVILEVLGR